MKTTRLTMPGMAVVLLLSVVAQADEADNAVTSGQLREQSRLYADADGRGLPANDGVNQRNRVWSMQGVQDGSYTATPAQTRQQIRTQEQKRLRKREHAGQGSGAGSGYGKSYESRNGYGSGSGGYGRSGGQGGGRR